MHLPNPDHWECSPFSNLLSLGILDIQGRSLGSSFKSHLLLSRFLTQAVEQHYERKIRTHHWRNAVFQTMQEGFFHYLKGSYKKDGERLSVRYRTKDNRFKQTKSRFRLVIMRKFFTARVARDGNRLCREACCTDHICTQVPVLMPAINHLALSPHSQPCRKQTAVTSWNFNAEITKLFKPGSAQSTSVPIFNACKRSLGMDLSSS